ncbi:hypothetical protein SELMODRAFT_423039 [Selaginella moellendorffii]|uniref:Methyltransferase type 11 domain-containing protein n=1 Tax=Selaginella moellendorffii TaxID=88036 RepID=D8SKD2_SELML|nr:hypothetical protein SELMODRAFT_423039 [Selaginella moellendorffii]
MAHHKVQTMLNKFALKYCLQSAESQSEEFFRIFSFGWSDLAFRSPGKLMRKICATNLFSNAMVTTSAPCRHGQHPRSIAAQRADPLRQTRVGSLCLTLFSEECPEVSGSTGSARRRGDGFVCRDFVDGLISLDDSDKLSDQEIIVRYGGCRIQTSTIEWYMSEVISKHEVMRNAQEELDQIIGRGGRIRPPKSPIHPGDPQGGPPPPPGVAAGAPPPRGARRWPWHHNPRECKLLVNEFQPERFLSRPGQHVQIIPFSVGRRLCAGYGLAMRSLFFLLATRIQLEQSHHSIGTTLIVYQRVYLGFKPNALGAHCLRVLLRQHRGEGAIANHPVLCEDQLLGSSILSGEIPCYPAFFLAPSAPKPGGYGEISYWDKRYAEQPDALVLGLLQIRDDCPNVNDMVEDGYREIVNTDLSSMVIDNFKARYAHVPQLSYSRDMSAFQDCSFDAVIDKGLAGAMLERVCVTKNILCGVDPAEGVLQMRRETYRILKPQGVFMLITYGHPEIRMPALLEPGLKWSILVYALAKPATEKAVMETIKGVTPDSLPIDERN